MEEIIEELCTSYGSYLEVDKNTILITEYRDDQNACIYYLINGICALSGFSKNGTEHIFLYHLPERLIGFNPYLSSGHAKSFAYSGPFIQTKTECCLYRIPVTAFKHYLDTSLKFNQYMIRLLSENYHHTLAHFKETQEETSITVICRFLLAMHTDTGQGQILSRFFTHNEISKYLGLHIVTVSKIMLKLKTMGYVEKVPSGLLIKNLEALQEMVQSCKSFKY